MDPLPLITKVFSLVIQEAKQREVVSMNRTGVDTTTLMLKIENL